MIAASMFSASPRYQSLHQRRKSTEFENGRFSLAPSDKNNGDYNTLRNKEVNTGNKSATTTPPQAATLLRRFPSPNLGRSTNIQDNSKRATSAERRSRGVSSSTKAIAAANNSTVEATLVSKRLWPSSQSMSSSMQSDSSSLSSSSLGCGRFGAKEKHGQQASDHTLKPTANGTRRSAEPSPKRKPTPERKGTPERKDIPERKGGTPERRTPVRRQIADQTENARPSDNNHYRPDIQRWPSTRSTKISASALNNRAESIEEKQKASTEAASFLVQGKSIKTISRSSILPAPPLRSTAKYSNEGVAPPSSQVTRRLVLESRVGQRSDPGHEKSSEKDKETSEKDIKSNSSFKLAGHSIHVRQSIEEAQLASADAIPAHLESMDDSDSVASGGSGVVHQVGSGAPASGNKIIIGGTTVPARFWQELGSRVRRLSEGRSKSFGSESEFSLAVGAKGLRRTKVPSLGPLSSANAVANGAGNPFTTAWALSPRKLAPISVSNPQTPATPLIPAKPIQPSSPSRRMPSPTRIRGAILQSTLIGNRVDTAPGLINFGSESFKGRKALGQYEEALSLRIMHNRCLQWRFVNARTEAAMNAQSAAAENLLYNAWMQTTNALTSVAMKRIQLRQARHAAKLDSILSSHGQQLEECESLQQTHLTALFGAREALSATILRVPITAGARVRHMLVIGIS
ncbi:hypothetical protein O6H91_02G071500 [Diphasiastrum complanatum]|uniref:Uncharacterized protein n=1 Tax=Diphasiastrum complanatum TaxID=34168 RepID=A0ACC2EH28_DIPCM|nr:hypothetical protein O6H91_02G071500 [Diphasiastrum complanatum]